MKKFIFIFAALFLGLSQVSAQEIYVDNFTAPEGGVQKFDVKYRGIKGRTIQGYIFKFKFPEGLSLVTEDGVAIYEPGEGNANFDVKTTATGVQASPKSKSSKLAGDEGVLVTLTLQVNNPLVEGSTANVNVYGASLTEKVVNEDETSSYKDLDTDPFDFTVTIIENRITLDENVGVTSETPTGEQNVLVKRTINAGNWSTICLPFAMTSAQVATAFGEKVKIAEFTGCKTENNEEDEAVSIKINFESKSDKSIEANHPYIILIDKSDDSITEFEVDGVTIEPSEELSVDKDEYRTGSGTKKDPYVYHYNSFVGTYNAETVLEDEDILFISGNKFYYSNGTTTMKAFRGYFEFYDVLADKNVSAAKIGYSVDDETTSIDGISGYQIVEGVYDLSGRKIQLEDNDLNKLQKGVYIIDGKKVTIK